MENTDSNQVVVSNTNGQFYIEVQTRDGEFRLGGITRGLGHSGTTRLDFASAYEVFELRELLDLACIKLGARVFCKTGA